MEEVVCINDDYNQDEGNTAVGPASQGGGGEEQVGGARSPARIPSSNKYII